MWETGRELGGKGGKGRILEGENGELQENWSRTVGRGKRIGEEREEKKDNWGRKRRTVRELEQNRGKLEGNWGKTKKEDGESGGKTEKCRRALGEL